MTNVAAARRCEFCGYDLRGIPSAQCPECGRAKSLSLRFDDSEHYYRARAALEQAGLLLSFVNAESAIEVAYGSAKTVGWLRVSSLEHERCADILHDIGVRWIEESSAFVRADEQNCPRCGADLPEHASEACSGCGVSLHWLDGGEQLLHDEDVVCFACLRDVRVVDGRCPECDANLVNHDSPEPQSDAAAVGARSRSDRISVWVLLTTLLSIPIMLVISSYGAQSSSSWQFSNLLWALPIAAVVAGAIAARR